MALTGLPPNAHVGSGVVMSEGLSWCCSRLFHAIDAGSYEGLLQERMRKQVQEVPLKEMPTSSYNFKTGIWEIISRIEAEDAMATGSG